VAIATLNLILDTIRAWVRLWEKYLPTSHNRFLHRFHGQGQWNLWHIIFFPPSHQNLIWRYFCQSIWPDLSFRASLLPPFLGWLISAEKCQIFASYVRLAKANIPPPNPHPLVLFAGKYVNQCGSPLMARARKEGRKAVPVKWLAGYINCVTTKAAT